MQPFALSEWLHLGVLDRDIQSSPRRKLGRLPACYFVRERNSVGRIRTQVGMRFEVPEHRGDLRSSREETNKPRTLTAINLSKSSKENCSIGATIPTPALFTRMSMPENAPMVFATARRTAS